MIVALIVLAVLVVGALTGVLVWVASARPASLAAQTLSEPTSSAAHVPLPDAMNPASIDGLRFDVAVRGYRMQQVDAALDRLRDEIALRDSEISRLQVELDVARSAPTGDPELGHGPVVRPGAEDSLWSGVRSYQAGSTPRATATSGDADGTGATARSRADDGPGPSDLRDGGR